MPDTTRNLIGTWEMQHYLSFADLKTGTFGDYIRVTEDTKFDTSSDSTTYDAEYLCARGKTTYTTGLSINLEFEIDAILPGDIQAELGSREDVLNTPVQYMRTVNVDLKTGQKAEDTALPAKMRPGTLTMNPISGDANKPLVLSGSVALTGDTWTYGTFDATTGTFTPTPATPGA